MARAMVPLERLMKKTDRVHIKGPGTDLQFSIKGIGAVKSLDKESGVQGFNSHQYHGSISLVPIPKDRELPRLSATVWQNFRHEGLALANRIHSRGLAIVWSGAQEQAELYWEQLRGHGLTLGPLES